MIGHDVMTKETFNSVGSVWHEDTEIKAKANILLDKYLKAEKTLVEYCLKHNVALSIGEDKNASKDLILNPGEDGPDWKERGQWVSSTEGCSGW